MTRSANTGHGRPGVEPDAARLSSGPVSTSRPCRAWLGEGLLLALLVVMLLLPARQWTFRNLAAPTGDEATHLLAFLTFQEQFERSETLADWLTPALSWRDHNAYPPLVYQTVGLASALLGGLDLGDLACTNIGWVALATVATYLLGRRLFGGSADRPLPGQGRLVGFLAALVVGFSPIVLTQVPTFLLDLPAAATFLMALALLACSLDMEDRSLACLVGASVAGVALTKWLTILSLLPALLYVVLRVHRAMPGRERAALLGALTGLVAALATATWLALRFPPPAEPALNALYLPGVCRWVAGLTATCLVLLGLAFWRIRYGPARNLLLAASLAFLLAAPFYLTNLEMLWLHLSHELGESSLWLERTRHHGFFIADVAHGLPLGALVVPGLLWLALRGPQGGFALVGIPLLVNQAVAVALSLPDPRHYLAGYPLEILAASAWLLALRPTRTVAGPLLLALGLWNLGTWITGVTPPTLRAGPLEQLPGYRGCGPESLIGGLRLVTDATNAAVGPGVHAVGARVEPFPLSYLTLQALAASRKHPLLFRGVEDGGRRGPTQTANWAVKFAALTVPELPARDIRYRAEAPLQDLADSWVLVLKPTSTERPVATGSPLALSAPPGFRALLYPAARFPMP